MVEVQFYGIVDQLNKGAGCFFPSKASFFQMSISIAWVSVEGADEVVVISHDTYVVMTFYEAN